MYRAEKRKFATQQEQVNSIKSSLFPNNNLQERVENFSSYYATYGKEFIITILNNSAGFEQNFGILKLED